MKFSLAQHILTFSLLPLFTCHLLAHDDQQMTAKSFVSWTSSKLEARPTASGTFGMFAKGHIGKDEPVAVFGGTIISKQQAVQPSDDVWNINGSDTLEPVDYINHSCNPNAGMREQILLVAMRDIAPDEEVTFDYGMVVSEWVGTEPIACNCGSVECRKTILQDDWKNKRLQNRAL